MLDGKSQVLLQVQMFQLAHTTSLNTGIQPPQSLSAFNVYTEEQSILNANQAGAADCLLRPGRTGDTLAILGILLAPPGFSSLFSNGVALFGGGLARPRWPGRTSFNLNLNTSDSKELDDMQLHLGDGD